MEYKFNPLRLGETKIDQSYNYLLGEKLFFFLVKIINNEV